MRRSGLTLPLVAFLLLQVVATLPPLAAPGGSDDGADLPSGAPGVRFTISETDWGIKFTPWVPTAYSADGFTWYFGDNTTSTARAPTHYYRSPGLYEVTLMVDLHDYGVVIEKEVITVGESSTMTKVAHSVDLNAEGLHIWIGEDEVVWSELSLVISGALLIASTMLSSWDARRLRKRKVPDKLKPWRMVCYLLGAAFIFMVIWIEAVLKTGMVG